MWKMNCAQLAGFNEALTSKKAEIEALKERISQLEGMVHPGSSPPVSSSPVTTVSDGVAARTHETHKRRGEARPVSQGRS